MGMAIWNAPRELVTSAFCEITEGLHEGVLQPEIGVIFPLAQSAEAHRAVLRPGHHVGKTILSHRSDFLGSSEFFEPHTGPRWGWTMIAGLQHGGTMLNGGCMRGFLFLGLFFTSLLSLWGSPLAFTCPILTAPASPDQAMLEAEARDAMFVAELTRELPGSDFLHLGGGRRSAFPRHASCMRAILRRAGLQSFTLSRNLPRTRTNSCR